MHAWVFTFLSSLFIGIFNCSFTVFVVSWPYRLITCMSNLTSKTWYLHNLPRSASTPCYWVVLTPLFYNAARLSQQHSVVRHNDCNLKLLMVFSDCSVAALNYHNVAIKANMKQHWAGMQRSVAWWHSRLQAARGIHAIYQYTTKAYIPPPKDPNLLIPVTVVNNWVSNTS